jgi:predicted transglutaminase-like cysteine proteinase
MRIGKPIQSGQTIVVKKRGNNSDIINTIHSYMPYAIGQSKKRASIFKGKDDKETCRNIWSFLKHNIKYVEDSIHFQDIKLPDRLVKERKGDCKSYSMFAASILENLGIPYKFAYTSYTNNRTPSHVYVQTNDGCIIDAVWKKFNDEKPYTYKYLKR